MGYLHLQQGNSSTRVGLIGLKSGAWSLRYRSYMRSRAWRARRLEVIRRARGICERCGRMPVVNVHHLTYERVGREDPSDLIGVCLGCHQELHS